MSEQGISSESRLICLFLHIGDGAAMGCSDDECIVSGGKAKTDINHKLAIVKREQSTASCGGRGNVLSHPSAGLKSPSNHFELRAAASRFSLKDFSFENFFSFDSQKRENCRVTK